MTQSTFIIIVHAEEKDIICILMFTNTYLDVVTLGKGKI